MLAIDDEDLPPHDVGGAGPRLNATPRVALLLLAAGAAFHSSLRNVAQSLGSQTPLAYSTLAPLIALAVALGLWSYNKREPAVPDHSDRRWGVLTLAGALSILCAPSLGLWTGVWAARADLVALPLFVAGGLLLLFGRRVLGRLWYAVVLLLLAWPLLYSLALFRALPSMSGLTVSAVASVLRVINVASHVPGAARTEFKVHHHPPFQISIAASCSGIDSFVGFLIVAAALQPFLLGRWTRRVGWLLVGIVFMWMLNTARIVIILVAGHFWGARVAIDWLHPVLGLILFNLGVVLLVLGGGRLFGLRLRRHPQEQSLRSEPAALENRSSARKAVRLGAVVLIGAAGAASVADGRLPRWDITAGNTPGSALTSLARHDPPGWALASTVPVVWAEAYFGDGSSWTRSVYRPDVSPDDPGDGDGVVVDAITTSDRHSLSVYAVNAYFDGYRVWRVRVSSLGGGIRGLELDALATRRSPAIAWVERVNLLHGTLYRAFFLAPARGHRLSEARAIRLARLYAASQSS